MKEIAIYGNNGDLGGNLHLFVAFVTGFCLTNALRDGKTNLKIFLVSIVLPFSRKFTIKKSNKTGHSYETLTII